MEPVTIMAAFSAVKAGISAGQEIVGLVKPLAQLFDEIDDAKVSHNKKKNRPSILSANEEALDTFIKKKQAEDIEQQLREVVIATRGISAWNELVALRTKIRVDRKTENERIKQEKTEKLELAVMIGALLLVPALIFGIVMFIINNTPK